MGYFGAQGLYSSKPIFRHADGTINSDQPARLTGWHDDCAHDVFSVDTTVEGYGSWHHDKGISWHPGTIGVKCSHCTEDC